MRKFPGDTVIGQVFAFVKEEVKMEEAGKKEFELRSERRGKNKENVEFDLISNTRSPLVTQGGVPSEGFEVGRRRDRRGIETGRGECRVPLDRRVN